MFIKALLYAKEKHRGQKRIGGESYISHPVAVATMLEEKGFDKKYVLTGLFHDLIEDTDAKEEEILSLSCEEVLLAVKLLTKTKDYKNEEYIRKIKENHLARMVKLADRLHNLTSAVVTNDKFKKRYIKETNNYYLDLAKDTPFELDILEALKQLEKTLKN